MQIEYIHDLKDIVTGVGAVVIPIALYYIKMEIKSSGEKIDRKLDVHIQSFNDHCKRDEDYQERTDESLDKIKGKLNIL